MFDLGTPDQVLIAVASAAAVATYYVSIEWKQGPVKASALLSLLVALLFRFAPHGVSAELAAKIPAAFFGASFAGMSSKDVIHSYKWMAAAGAIFGVIFTHASGFFTGYGGGLGTTALLSVVMIFGLIKGADVYS